MCAVATNWLTLEGEQEIKFQQLSGDIPLNHNKKKCKMSPNNNHDEYIPSGAKLVLSVHSRRNPDESDVFQNRGALRLDLAVGQYPGTKTLPPG